MQLDPDAVTFQPYEIPEAGYKLGQGLQLIRVADDDRGSVPKVLARLDAWLLERRKRREPVSKFDAHPLAIQLGVVLGHQLKKSRWTWVSLKWTCPLPVVTPMGVKNFVGFDGPYRDEVAEHFGMVNAEKSLVVLPIYELLVVQLEKKVQIGFAASVAELTKRRPPPGLELARLTRT